MGRLDLVRSSLTKEVVTVVRQWPWPSSIEWGFNVCIIWEEKLREMKRTELSQTQHTTHLITHITDGKKCDEIKILRKWLETKLRMAGLLRGELGVKNIPPFRMIGNRYSPYLCWGQVRLGQWWVRAKLSISDRLYVESTLNIYWKLRRAMYWSPPPSHLQDVSSQILSRWIWEHHFWLRREILQLPGKAWFYRIN